MATRERESFVAPPKWIEMVRERMKLQRLTDAELARQLGVNQGVVSRLFKGKGQPGTAMRVAEYLSVPLLFYVESYHEAMAMELIKRMHPRRLSNLVTFLSSLEASDEDLDDKRTLDELQAEANEGLRQLKAMTRKPGK